MAASDRIHPPLGASATATARADGDGELLSLADLAKRREAARRPDTMHAAARRSDEQLSPELVLVSPDLRAEALAALPDRPWEAFLPPPEQPATVASAAVPAADAAVEPATHPPEPQAPDRRRVRVVSLLAAGFVAGFLVAEFVPRAAGPTLVQNASQPQAAAPRTAAAVRPQATAPRTTAAAQPQAPRSRTAPAAQPQAPASRPPAATTRVRTRPRPRSATSRATPIAGGGYVFGRRGRFRVSANSHAITGFQAQVRCARSIGIPKVRLRSGRFAYRAGFRLQTGGVLRVSVAGRFLDRTRARGFVRARLGRCDSGRVAFVARLS